MSNDQGVEVDSFRNTIFRNTGGPIIGNSGGAAMPLSDPNTNITY